jgi:hypothetical protein
MMLKQPFRYFIFPVLAITVLSCGSSRHSGKSRDLMPGTWQSQPIIVDGDSKDWPSPYPNYDAKSMVAYATSNDKDNLYITMETGDDLTQIKILKRGLTVSIDTTGKKEQTFKIDFPLPNDEDLEELLPPKDRQKKDAGSVQLGKQLSHKLSKSADEANQFSLDGFRNCSGGYMVSQTNNCGIKVKLKIDEYKQLVWEAEIPFKAIYHKDVITAADAGRPISVCFTVKGFKSKGTKNINNTNGAGTNESMNSGGVGGGGRTNSRPMGSGGRGGGRTSATDPMERLYESTKTWKHFSIAYQ